MSSRVNAWEVPVDPFQQLLVTATCWNGIAQSYCGLLASCLRAVRENCHIGDMRMSRYGDECKPHGVRPTNRICTHVSLQ